jgi:hypothetical protein
MTTAIAVKPLEWRDNEAQSPVGHYRVQRLDDKWEPLRNGDYMLPKHGGVVKAFDTFDQAKAAAQADYESRILSALTPHGEEAAATPAPQHHVVGEVVDWIGTVVCPCTTLEQDETCPLGSPSLLCGACGGKGVVKAETVIALAAEMLKVAEQVDELEDPFAAWETIDLLKAEKERLFKINGEHCDAVNTYIGRVSALEDENTRLRASLATEGRP